MKLSFHQALLHFWIQCLGIFTVHHKKSHSIYLFIFLTLSLLILCVRYISKMRTPCISKSSYHLCKMHYMSYLIHQCDPFTNPGVLSFDPPSFFSSFLSSFFSSFFSSSFIFGSVSLPVNVSSAGLKSTVSCQINSLISSFLFLQ